MLQLAVYILPSHCAFMFDIGELR